MPIKEIYFTPKQAAACFNLSLSTIKNYIYAGKLKTLKTPGGHHRISKAELLRTLGEEGSGSKRNMQECLVMDDLCAGMLTTFKAFGPQGDSLIMHSRETAALSSRIAKMIGMSEADVRRVEIAGRLHDIGNIGIDKALLLKTGKLSLHEYEIIKKHPDIGREVLSSMIGLKDIAEIIAQHHERMDGMGYPLGLKGYDILIAARIISIAEAYVSMVSEHSYRRPVSKPIAIDELMKGKDTQFDGDIVKAAVELLASD